MLRASPYSFAVLERLLREHFPFPRRILQAHALLLTSGAQLSATPCAAFPYNCLAHAHLRASSSPTSSAPLRLFSAMLARGARPNRHTFPTLLKSASCSASLHAQCLRRGLAADRFVACSLVSAYARRSDHHRAAGDARKVFDDMELEGTAPDLASRNALLDALCRAGDLRAAERFFSRHMPVRDAVSWTTIISGLSRAGRHARALQAFADFQLLEHHKQGRKQRLGEATLVTVLSACANLDGARGLSTGKSIHAYTIRHNLHITPFLGTALVDMYGKHGNLHACTAAFNTIPTKTSPCTWNALLCALANYGGKETRVLSEFRTMTAQEGVAPNHATFVAVLTACARAKPVDAGAARWFETMVAEHELAPRMAHYGCVVHLLGRAGRFADAVRVIDTMMPFPADVSVWGALLGACRIHGNAELAAEVARKLTALGARQPGPYVTVRNVYLEDGNWFAATRMGDAMREAGIKKTVGRSSVS